MSNFRYTVFIILRHWRQWSNGTIWKDLRIWESEQQHIRENLKSVIWNCVSQICYEQWIEICKHHQSLCLWRAHFRLLPFGLSSVNSPLSWSLNPSLFTPTQIPISQMFSDLYYLSWASSFLLHEQSSKLASVFSSNFFVHGSML